MACFGKGDGISIYCDISFFAQWYVTMWRYIMFAVCTAGQQWYLIYWEITCVFMILLVTGSRIIPFQSLKSPFFETSNSLEQFQISRPPVVSSWVLLVYLLLCLSVCSLSIPDETPFFRWTMTRLLTPTFGGSVTISILISPGNISASGGGTSMLTSKVVLPTF